MTSEDDAWAQTLITVTPEEDATLRKIADTTIVSSTQDVNLVLDPDEIVMRRPLRQFVDTKEAKDEVPVEPEKLEQPEEKPKEKPEDAEVQTYLQGIPVVHISTEYRDEASQTMYMHPPYPPLQYFRDIMTSMKEGPMPDLKRSNVAATIISFHPETPQDVVIDQLSADVTDEEREEFVSKLSDEEERDMDIAEILHFILIRVFWIDDPTSQIQPETADKTVQTYIKYNNRTKIFVIDNQVQTDLSCEPKESNTMLLSDYWETKNMILNYLEDCITKGIEVRIIVDDIIDEIIDKCAERVRYPMKEQSIQTIATYKLDKTEKDVLKKLKLDIIVDPLEASIIVLPLIDDLLQIVCVNVSKNAAKNVKIILNRILQRTTNIITKLMELEKQAQRKPIDQVLAKRKKKILELLSKKETETIATQTSIAAISEVKKIIKSKEVLCSVCRRQSMCQYCTNSQKIEDVPQEEFKILRTQDILLAYKPCYIMTKISQENKNLEITCPEKNLKSSSKLQVSCSMDSKESRHTICVFLQSNKLEPRESFNEWSYVTEATIMKPCSIKESTNNSSQTTVSSLDPSFQPVLCSTHSTLTSQAATALQILKNTFCTRETCFISSQQTSLMENEKVCSCSKSSLTINNTSCTQQTCKAFSKLHLPNTCNIQCPIKSHGDGFKIIPIHLSKDSSICN